MEKLWKKSKNVRKLESDCMPVLACSVDHSSALSIKAVVARAKAALKEDPPLRSWSEKDTKKPVVEEEFGTDEGINVLLLGTLYVDDPSDEAMCAVVRPGTKMRSFADEWSIKMDSFVMGSDGQRCNASLTYDAECDGPWQEMLAGLMANRLEFATSVCIFTTDKKLTPFQVKRVNSRVAGQSITLQFSSGTTRLIFKCNSVTSVLRLHTMGQEGAEWTTEGELAQADSRIVETALRTAGERASIAHTLRAWENNGVKIPATEVLQVKCGADGTPVKTSTDHIKLVRTRKADGVAAEMSFMDGVVHSITAAGAILAESSIRNQNITPAIEDRGFMTALALILMAKVEYDQNGETAGFVVTLRKKLLKLMGTEESELKKRKAQYEVKKKEVWEENKAKGIAEDEIKKIFLKEAGGEPEMDGTYELYRQLRAQLENDESKELENARESKALDGDDTKVPSIKPKLTPKK